jgi:hypothetical protein
MTLQQFVNKWLGQEADFDGFYGGQCVDLFRFYCRDVLKISQPKGVVGAKDFWTNYDSDLNLKNNFTKIANTPSFIPIDGDVAVWNANTGNGYGHIAMVIGDEHTTSYFYSFDQNWSKVSFCEIVKHTYNNFYGVLRPKSIPEGDNMSDYEEAIRKAVGYDNVCSVLGQPTTTSSDVTNSKISEIISDKERYLRERNEARIERDNYAEEIKAKDIQINLLKKDITALNNELEECQNQVPGEEDLEQDYEITGKKIIEVSGNTTIETSYKRKA